MAKISLDRNRSKGPISRYMYGHFAEHLGRCIYGGIFVGKDSPIPNENGMRKDVVDAMKKLQMPVLRWPGGCFADEYHWRDGIGEQKDRKRMGNTHRGGVEEDNSFGTHEFLSCARRWAASPILRGTWAAARCRK